MKLAVYRIHRFNFLYLIFLNYWHEIYFYKTTLNLVFVKKYFTQLPTFSGMDHWVECLEETYDKSKCNIQNVHASGWIVESRIEKLFNQQLIIELEQAMQFLFLVKASGAKLTILDSFSLKTLKKYHLFSFNEIYGSFLNSFCEFLEAFFLNFRKYLKFIFSLSLPFQKLSKVKVIFNGISSSEIPTSKYSSDFSWPSKLGYLKNDEVLYIIPTVSTASAHLPEDINLVKERDIIGKLPLKERFRLLWSIVGYCKIFLFGNQDDKFFASRNYFEYEMWMKLLKELSPEIYVTSISRGWPEDVAIGASRNLSIKSVIWFYGTGEYYYSDKPVFRDVNIRFSYILSDEVWVWSEEIKKLFEARQLIPNKESPFKISGPLMNGDFHVLLESKKSLREKFGVSDSDFLISVFDLTPHRPDFQLNCGVGPYVTREMMEEFYEKMEELLALDSRIKLLIKPKRGEAQEYENIFQLKKLLQKSDRIISCPFNLNPYTPIGASDFVVSAMITSPSILAHKMGVPSAYLNTTKTIGNVSQFFPKDLICHDFESLKKKILNALQDPPEQEFNSFVASLDKFLKNQLGSTRH